MFMLWSRMLIASFTTRAGSGTPVGVPQERDLGARGEQVLGEAVVQRLGELAALAVLDRGQFRGQVAQAGLVGVEARVRFLLLGHVASHGEDPPAVGQREGTPGDPAERPVPALRPQFQVAHRFARLQAL